MSRQENYQFVDTDSAAIIARLTSAYENITGRTLQPADPDKLFISWVAGVIVQERTSQNYTGNQNIPSRAEGENLDALGEWIFQIKRLAAQASKCTIRFILTAAQNTSVLVPKGTRVTDASNTLVWATTEDALVAIGETAVDVMAQCTTVGEEGNGFVAGQINSLIDVDNILYFLSCSNIDTSSGGSAEANDDEYYEFIRSGLDSYSTAGPAGAYIYWAKSVSSNIADVKAIQPKIERAETLDLYSAAGGIKHAFAAGEHILPESLKVFVYNSTTQATLGTDYNYEYTNGLLNIRIKTEGILFEASKIDITVDHIMAGYVYLYAIMNDGTIASPVVKSAILSACNADTVRPITDYVFCQDAELVSYDIELTYYIKRGTKTPVADIQIAVNNAVEEYISWQCDKIGRDINPSELNWRLSTTEIKRAVITYPEFTELRNGDDHTVPQIASIGQIRITNGGFEDE